MAADKATTRLQNMARPATVRDIPAFLGSFESMNSPRRRIATPSKLAIVGGGIAGLFSILAIKVVWPSCNITLFEALPTLGGRIRDVSAEDGTLLPMGAMRFSPMAHPLTANLLQQLEIPIKNWPYKQAIYVNRAFDKENSDADQISKLKETLQHTHLMAPKVLAKWIDNAARITGYNIIKRLPVHEALTVLSHLPEIYPEFWKVPEAGLSSLVSGLENRCSSVATIRRKCRVTSIELLPTDGKLSYLICARDGVQPLRQAFDAVIHATGPGGKGALRGELATSVSKITRQISSEPKFRAWLPVQRPTIGSNSYVFTMQEPPRRLYVSGNWLMIYADGEDAFDLLSICDQQPEALYSFLPTLSNYGIPDFQQRLNAGIHTVFWPRGVNFASIDRSASMAAAVPAGFEVVDEALTAHHGFVEGALRAALSAVATMSGTPLPRAGLPAFNRSRNTVERLHA